MPIPKHNTIGLLLALTLAGASVIGEAAAQPTCLSDWSVAGPIVRREGLATIEQVGQLAQQISALTIVNSALCRTGGRYVYRLVVRDHAGKMRTLFVDAKTPFKSRRDRVDAVKEVP